MKIALLSAAHVHTPGYLSTIKKRKDLELAVVWDDMPERGRAIAEEMGCPFEPDLTAALATDGLDLTCICADNASHRPLVEASAAAGLDLFCEKPMALSVADADAMLAAIKDSGVIAVFGFFQPYTGAALAARQYLAEGKLGTVTQINYRNAHAAAYILRFEAPEYRWFVEPEKSGGGAFCDMGAHAMHFVRLVFGPVTTVNATISNKSGNYTAVDDHGVALLGLESGATCILEASWVNTGLPSGLQVIGSRGVLELSGENCQVTPFDGKSGTPETLAPLAPEPSRLERLLAIKEGKLDRAKADDELGPCRDAVAISVVAYQSSESGDRIEL